MELLLAGQNVLAWLEKAYDELDFHEKIVDRLDFLEKMAAALLEKALEKAADNWSETKGLGL